MLVKDLNMNFCEEGFDENGVLNKFEIKCEQNFNFAYDVVDKIAELDPNRPAIHWCNDHGEDHIFTYGELSEKSNQVANMFLDAGIKKGDKVLTVLKRHYQFWFTVMALCKIGAVIIPATNQLQKKDYTYRFEAADVKFLVATAENDVPSIIDDALTEYSHLKGKFIVRGKKDGWVSFDKKMDEYPKTLQRLESNVNDDMLLYFTSGTTGYPKMVSWSHYYSLAHLPTGKHWHHIHENSIHFTVSESGWGKCMWGKMYGQFFMGASILVYDFDKFNPTNMLTHMASKKVTSFCAPPTIFRFLIKEWKKEYDLSSLEYATVAGEALNPEVFNKFYEFTGIKLMEGFGQTETVLLIANTPGMEPKPGSMGRPMPLYDVDIVDEDGNSLPNGETGEIVVHTKNYTHKALFKGYYKNDQGTKSAWHDDMYHTGDTAWKDEDGYFWYVGRTDDVIKASGYRIGPFEIESVMMEHPSVLEVAVTGAEDPIRGCVVKATVVLTKEFKDKGDENLVKELQTHVKKLTAPYKYPRIIEFVEELPKTISGKIKRVDIRNNK